MNKDKKEKTEYFPHRPGFNVLLGYDEGRVTFPTEGMAEIYVDRNVKDGSEQSKQ